jgi:hypothetical protein
MTASADIIFFANLLYSYPLTNMGDFPLFPLTVWLRIPVHTSTLRW